MKRIGGKRLAAILEILVLTASCGTVAHIPADNSNKTTFTSVCSVPTNNPCPSPKGSK